MRCSYNFQNKIIACSLFSFLNGIFWDYFASFIVKLLREISHWYEHINYSKIFPWMFWYGDREDFRYVKKPVWAIHIGRFHFADQEEEKEEYRGPLHGSSFQSLKRFADLGGLAEYQNGRVANGHPSQ